MLILLFTQSSHLVHEGEQLTKLGKRHPMSAAGSPAGLLLTQGMPVCEPDKGASSWAAAALDPAPQPLGGRPVLTPPVAACSPQEPIHVVGPF